MNEQPSGHASLLTPPGVGAIAVVRLRGPGVAQFIANHLDKSLQPLRCVHCKLVDGPRVIDDPVVVLSDDHQTLDINLHGGQWIVRECLELARRAGFEIREATSDPLDAADLIEREALESLPTARTEEAIRALLAQPRLWRTLLDPHKPALQGRVSAEALNGILADHSLWWLLNPPKVAIVGAPNVGKSTLANRLFGQERSITADLPGTTRDYVGDWTNLAGLPVLLLDTPGQRETADPIERQAIARSRAPIAQADLIIHVLDPTIPLDPQRAIHPSQDARSLMVINKSDLPAVWDTKSVDAVHTVATKGIGVDLLEAKIREMFQQRGDVATETARWWTQRQREIIERQIRERA